VHRMIEQSIVHLPELVKDIERPVSIYLVHLSSSREVMDAKQAADFLRTSESEFKRMAPGLPRHVVTERRYIYLRSELLTWLLGR
jgi:hypothetical protein